MTNATFLTLSHCEHLLKYTKRAAALTAAAASAALILAASPAAQAKHITVALSAAFTTLDSYDSPDTITKAVARAVYEGLFTFDKDMNPVPLLAEGYERSADGLTYTVRLKKGVQFHDGTEFDAEAVKLNFDRVLRPNSGLTRRAIYTFIDTVKVVDKYTVQFTLKYPHGGFIRRLAMNNTMMVCPSLIKAAGGNKTGLALKSCGTGPYIQEEFNPSEKFVVKKNPNYRIKGLPKLDGITFIPVPENSTRAAMIRTGEADFITTVPLEQIKSLEADEPLNVTAIPSIMQKHLDLNNFFKPFSDKRVRQAINYAINKDALVKVAYNGYAVPQYGILASQYPGAVKLGPWPYNPQKARELLKEAGYPNGFSTILWSGYNDTTSGKVVQFLQQQLAQVGIKVETKLLEPGVRTELILHVKGAADSKSRLFYIGWSDGSFDPDQVLRPILHSTQQPPVYMNTTYYANKHFDELIDKALVEPNEAKRNQLYEDAQKTAWEDAPWAFLLFEMSTGASNKHLKNFNMMVDQSFEFYNAEWVE